MAHESFEDQEVASILNNNYVSIKVDREERPDIDSIYMKVCQMMTGHGGWPLTIMMTPDKIPFYAGTYFPKLNKYGLPGIIEVLTQLSKKFKEDPEHIDEVTESVRNALSQTIQAKSSKRLTLEETDKAFDQLRKSFDFAYGGFGGAPKFPQAQNLMFLLKYYYFTGNKIALEMVESTLQHLVNGGIYDHIGFGFARYSTDEKWLVPHFEKMLYDNALLLMVYTECYQITKNPFYKKIGKQVIAFLEREMKSEEGAFYSAIDADSEGVEGKYYVWDNEEIYNLLGEELGELYASTYNITLVGNFEGKNIPNLIGKDKHTIAKANNLSFDELEEKLEEARILLLKEREKRVYPHVDDKVLTSWNAMVIAALSKAGKAFNNQQYVQAAEKALRFIEENLFQNGRLMARFRDGETKHKGYLDDYSYLLWAYIELYELTFNLTFIKRAKDLSKQMMELFWDEQNGGFYFTGRDSEQLIAQDKEIYDGALPSGNSVAAVMLTKLAYITGETKYLDTLEEMYFTFYEDISRLPSASSYFIQSLLLAENPTKEVVIIGDDEMLISKIKSKFLPNVSFLISNSVDDFTEIAPFATQYKQLNEKTTVYICENFSCQQPTNEIEAAWENIIK